MDFRAMSKRVPEDLFPGGVVRIYLGDPSTKTQRRALVSVRESLKAVARRQDWDVLRRVKDGEVTPEAVHTAIRRVGLDSYRSELEPTHQTPELGEAADAWDHRGLSDSTSAKYTQTLEWLVDHLGPETPMDPEHITRSHIRDALRALEDEGLAENTRALYLTAWSSFFTWWREREEERHERGGPPPRMTQHPVHRLKAVHKPKVRATRDRFLSLNEWHRLKDAAQADVRAAYATLLYCGLRPSEMRWLRPQDVRLPDAVDIRARDGWEPKGYSRWGVGEGSIPIHRVHLLPLLKEHAERYAGADFFFLNPRTGEQWRELAFRKQLEADCRRAGIPYGRNTEHGITPHVFRHSLGSWLAQADVQLIKIAELLRDRPSTVAKHYAHLLPRDLDETLHRVL